MSAAEPRVVCIILNWNGWVDTLACLDAMQNCIYEQVSIVVVDNASTDGSVAKIRAAYPDITLIESEMNLGCPGGNNLGLRYALSVGADYVWLLNNDTEPFLDALSTLVAKAQTDMSIGAVSSICFYADAPHQVQAWGGAKVNLWTGFAKNSTIERSDDWFDSLYGASYLLRTKALRDVGLIDEGFFLYWDEAELSLRLRKRGWKLAAASNSHVLHKVNASTKGNGGVRDRHFTASGLRILKLHSPVPLLSMFIFIAVRFVSRLLRLRFSRLRSVCAGIADYFAQRPIIQKIH